MINNLSVLIIEDEYDLNVLMKNLLEKERFQVVQAYSGEGAKKLMDSSFDLIILDLMLPDIDGFDLIPFFRSITKSPIIVVSAKDDDADLAIALTLGADDYIKKPYSNTELKARIKANLRRFNSYSYKDIDVIKTNNKISIGDLTLNLDNYILIKGNNEIQLTSKEFSLLHLFMKNPSKVFTKQNLYDLIWGEDFMSGDNTVTALIKRLREKLEDSPKSSKYIKTVWGIGYKLGDI
ncbi:MAG: response regulator transcription factor [Clostridium sp.]|uniref:response regulator transcription factor n=1 Tax=Clostridium sp. TaxID=1506 RepID=UPI003F2ED246